LQNFDAAPMIPSRPLGCAVLVLGLIVSAPAMAGAQRLEPLSAAVQTALAAAVADRAPPEPRFESPLERARWLADMNARLPQRSMPEYGHRVDFLRTVHYEAQRAGLDPLLVLGLIQVESGFRRYAVSSAGARGLMQIMPFWARQIGDGEPASLFDLRTNLRFGCVILRHYLDIERGDLFRALGRYNGSLGQAPYPNAVFAAARRWGWGVANPEGMVRVAAPINSNQGSTGAPSI